MKKDEQTYEEIEAFLKKELDEDRSKALLSRLEEDAGFKEEFNIHQDIYEAYKDPDVLAFKQKLNAFRTKGQQTEDQNSGGGTIRKISDGRPAIRRFLAIAASVLLVATVGVLWYINSNPANPGSLVAEYAVFPDEFRGSVRGGNEVEDSQKEATIQQSWESVNQLYSAGQYQQALDAIQAIPDIDPTFELQSKGGYYYHLGLIRLQLKQAPAAIQAFEQVKGTMFDEDARWNEAVAGLLLDDGSETARTAFQKLIDNGHPRSEEAKEILKKLK